MSASKSNNLESNEPQSIAKKLRDIDDRLEETDYRSDDLLFLHNMAEHYEVCEGLRTYSESLIEDYSEELLDEDIESFEQYRNPLEYTKTLLDDAMTLVSESYVDESGIEFFNGRNGELKQQAKLKAFKVMNTNIGREVVLNFMEYKPRGPFWDIAGASYGLIKGAKMELEERDIHERLDEVAESFRGNY